MNKKILLIILGVILIVLGFKSPMLLIFPMWIFVYLFLDKFKLLFGKLPLWLSFISLGVGFGLLTESFAIVENLEVASGDKVLLSPDPFNDLVLSFFYYLFVITTLYFLIKKYSYSKIEVFFLVGVYGVFAEEMGQVFLRTFTVPVFGFIYAIYVVFVYGIFPLLSYMICEDRFESKKQIGLMSKFLIGLFAMFLQWAIYGNFVYNSLNTIL